MFYRCRGCAEDVVQIVEAVIVIRFKGDFLFQAMIEGRAPHSENGDRIDGVCADGLPDISCVLFVVFLGLLCPFTPDRETLIAATVLVMQGLTNRQPKRAIFDPFFWEIIEKGNDLVIIEILWLQRENGFEVFWIQCAAAFLYPNAILNQRFR